MSYSSPAFNGVKMALGEMLPTSSRSFTFQRVVFLEIISNVEFFPAKRVLLQLTIDVRIVFVNFYDVGEFVCSV